MARFIVRRLLWMIPSIFIVTFLVYVACRIGFNPVAAYSRANPRASQEKIDQFIAENGLYPGVRGYIRGYFEWLRFWDVSGVEVALDSSGLRLETESLTAILIGGIAFEGAPWARPAELSAAEAEFTLFPNRDAAMKPTYTVKNTYILYFNHSVRGLSVGAPVDFLGVPVGEVISVKFAFNRE